MKDLRAYLEDIMQAILGLEQMSVQLTLNDFDSTPTRWAVERGLQIVGEALFKAEKIRPDLPITNLYRIIHTRHILVHAYDIVDRERLISILKVHLPILKAEVAALLQDSHS